VVVFGGFNGAALGDTWEFDGTTWTQRAIPGPPARSHGMMAYDSRHQRVLLYGGSSGGGVRRNDTWVLDGAG
jgi:hypothetical protein